MQWAGSDIVVILHNYGICYNNPDSEANARLMAAAPELYKLVIEELIPTSDYGGILSFMREARIRKVLDFIDGEEDGHE